MHNSKKKICVKRTFPELKSLPFKNYENMLAKSQNLSTTHLTLPNICKEVSHSHFAHIKI